MSPEEAGGEVIIFYSLEPEQQELLPNSCNFCSKQFKTEAKKKSHIAKYHVFVRSICDLCKKEFPSEQQLKKHVDIKHLNRAHLYKKECSICHVRVQQLHAHMRTKHDNLRKLNIYQGICPLCSKAFSNDYKVKRHIAQVHENIRPFECQECGKKFSETKDLHRHVKGVHRRQRVNTWQKNKVSTKSASRNKTQIVKKAYTIDSSGLSVQTLPPAVLVDGEESSVQEEICCESLTLSFESTELYSQPISEDIVVEVASSNSHINHSDQRTSAQATEEEERLGDEGSLQQEEVEEEEEGTAGEKWLVPVELLEQQEIHLAIFQHQEPAAGQPVILTAVAGQLSPGQEQLAIYQQQEATASDGCQAVVMAAGAGLLSPGQQHFAIFQQHQGMAAADNPPSDYQQRQAASQLEGQVQFQLIESRGEEIVSIARESDVMVEAVEKPQQLITLRWGQAPQLRPPQSQAPQLRPPQSQLHQQPSFYSRTFSLPAVDGHLPEILFSGGDHPEPEVILPDCADDGTGARAPSGEPSQRGQEMAASTTTPSSFVVSRPLDGYKCPRCARYFASFGLLKEHMTAAHADTANQASPQEVINTRIVRYRKDLNTFVEDETIVEEKKIFKKVKIKAEEVEDRIQCAQGCGKIFQGKSRSVQYQRHLERVHLKVRRNRCEECEAAFYEKRDLVRHCDAAHRHIKTLCPIEGCNKLVVRLDQHIKAVHQELTPAEKEANSQSTCPDCSQVFNRVYDMRRHRESVHLGRKKYKCSVCERSFTDRRDMTRHHDAVHLKIRQAAAELNCTNCGKAFRRKKDLLNHLASLECPGVDFLPVKTT